MNRRTLAACAALSLIGAGHAPFAAAQESRRSAVYPDELDRYSVEQIDNLVGPIALYPDALLAQVLVAATFPDQIEDAARFVRVNGTGGIDEQAWDVSVKAVAHYPSALNMMADKSDWTTALGRAYAAQSSDVMAAVQRLRAMADAQGNLRSTQEQSVTRDDDDYVIAPAQSRVIYVPVYDTYEVYRRPIFRSVLVVRRRVSDRQLAVVRLQLAHALGLLQRLGAGLLRVRRRVAGALTSIHSVHERLREPALPERLRES
jgi:Protein of unknown function (DUF3300)